MRYFLNIFLVLAIGLIGGGLSAKWAIESESGFGSVRIGSWTSWPLAGSLDADPYTKAKVARDGSVPLGAAEGLAFHLMADDKGKPLQRQCQYSISGSTPPARIWTLTVEDQDNRVIAAHDGGVNALYSQNILYRQDGTFTINIGPQPAPGNWLTTSGEGPMRLILRLYDTPITGSAGLVEPVMPKLRLRDCEK